MQLGLCSVCVLYINKGYFRTETDVMNLFWGYHGTVMMSDGNVMVHKYVYFHSEGWVW